MATSETLVSERRLTLEVSRILDIGERIFAILLSIPFLWAFGNAIMVHPTFVMLVACEMLTVFFILVRKRGLMAASPLAVLVAFGGTGFPLLARPGGESLVPDALSTSLIAAGLALAILSKLYLNRSFGLVAANRGVKVKGPYRFVRHPMYLGYMLNQLGFLLASFSIANVLVYLLAWTFQLLRIREEEKMLCQDAAYLKFASRVRSKLVPGIF